MVLWREEEWGLDGYFSPIGGRIHNLEMDVCTSGLGGHLSEVVFHRRLLGGSFAGMVHGGCVLGTLGSFFSGRARTVANLILGVRGTVATDVGVLVISMRLGLGKCTLLGKAREVVRLVSMVQGSGLG